MGRRKSKRPKDPFRWFLQKEAEAYDDSQQDGRPRNGVTWFSVDSAGRIAQLDSRCTGNVPREVFTNSKDEHLLLYEQFNRPSEERMTGDAEVDAPDQGLFYYEIVDYYKRPVLMAMTLTVDGYDRLGVSDSPLQVSECAEPIRRLLQTVQFDGLFSETPKLWVRKHWTFL